MIKTLLASTAIAALVTTSALATSDTATTPAAPATTEAVQTDATKSETVVKTDTTAATDAAMMTGNNLASKLIGSAVYASAAADADMIGDINDIVIDAGGQVVSVIVGVGGFLGMGEKKVAVSYDSIEWVERNGDRWLVANMTREQLEAAPEFNADALYADERTTTDRPAATAEVKTETDEQAEVKTEMAEEKAVEGQGNAELGESKVEQAENRVIGQIDRSTMTEVTMDKLSADNLIGRTVYGADDDNIGEIGDVLLSADNKVDGFVIDVGGFLGMGEKPVAISPEKLDIRADANGNVTVFTPFTKDQLEAQPAYSKETWEADRDNVILRVPAS